MNSLKKRSTIAPIVALVVTILALLLAMAGTAQAALDKESGSYKAEMKLNSLGVSLYENGERVAQADPARGSDGQTGVLLKDFPKESDELAIGKFYPEELKVKNEGSTAEYVRVSIHQYWADENGKVTSISPDLIDLDWVNEGDWAVEQKASEDNEQTILYSKNPLEPGQELAFISQLRIKPGIYDEMEIASVEDENLGGLAIDGSNRYVTVEYKGKKFGIAVEVDAVQTHNAADAIKSTWGIDAAGLGINVNA